MKRLSIAVVALMLTGCPALLGIDHDYGAAPPGGDGGGTGSRDADAQSGFLDAPPSSGDQLAPQSDAASGEPSDASSGPDVSGTVGADGASSVSCDSCTVAPLPSWSPVLFAASQTAPCPAGFAQSDVIEGAVATSATCMCGACAITAQPSCDQGSLSTTEATVQSSVNQSCTLPGPAVAANGGACTSVSLDSPMYLEVTPPSPQGATCSATSTANPASVTTQGDRVCRASTTCGACDPELSSTGFVECLMASGTQSCPSAAPKLHVVGDSFAVQCSACGCQVAATCQGTLSLYIDGACGALSQQVPAGTCAQMVFTDPGSAEWAGTVGASSCSVSGTSTATVALQNTRTICCP